MRVLRILLFCPLLTSMSAGAAWSQELTSLREAARAPGDNKPSFTLTSAADEKKSKRRSKSFFQSADDDTCDEDEAQDLDSMLGGLVGRLALWAASTPFTVPRAVVGDESFEAGYHLRYPYLHDRDAAIVDGLYSIEGAKQFMLRVNAEHIDDFSALSSTGGGLLLDTSHRWGLESQFHYRREDTQTLADELWTGDTNIVFRFAQSEQLQMRAGVGCNWLADEVDSEFGFNATYGGDWFPLKPFIISHELDWGKLGSATLFHGRVTAGVNYHRLETYVGYDYYDVGPADIAGMVAGVRLWLAR